jgi:threonine/homoserine/homoserine lactone efflux protein
VFEEVGVFYRGAVLGLMIAAPVGPIGLLCIRRTLQKGWLIGFSTGMGAACADTIFGAIAAFSVSAIVEFIQHYNLYIHMVGGMFLFAVAFHTWHDKLKPPGEPIEIVKKFLGLTREQTLMGSLKGFLTGFAITMTNPATIFGVLAVVATFGELKNNADAHLIVGGIFSGSALWWLMLSGGVALVRGHFTENRILIINRVTAVILAAIALWAVGSGIEGFLGRNSI